MTKTAREQLGVDLPEREIPVVQEPEPEGDARPDWLPEKFKDPSDFAKSYQELERELHSRGEKERLMEQRLESMETLINTINEPRQPEQQQQVPGNFNEQLTAAYETDPIGTMVFLAQNVAAQTVDSVLKQQRPQDQQQAQLQGEMVGAMAQRSLEAKFDDWAEYGPKVAEAISKDPFLMPDAAMSSVNTAAQRMEAIYKQVKYDDLNEKLSQAPQNQDLSAMKRQAQSVTGGVGRPGEPSEADAKIDRLIAAAKNNSYAAWRG